MEDWGEGYWREAEEWGCWRGRARGVLGEGESQRIDCRMEGCEGEEGGRKEERARSVFGR